MTTTVRPHGWLSALVSLSLLASLAVAVPVHAQDDAASDFETIVGQARDEAQATTNDLVLAIQQGCDAVSAEACNMGSMAPNMPTAAEAASDFADLLESLDVPEAYAEDVTTHVSALREIAAIRGAVADAATVNDEQQVFELLQQEAGTLAALASQLSPDYARFAFLSMSSADDYVGTFGGSTAEELAYLDDLRRAAGAAGPQFQCFGQAISVVYGDTDLLLEALYDCGAGTALPAIEAETRQLTAPARFADEHEWLLAERSEASRLDRGIGEAARDGDIITFLTNNVRLGMLYRPYPGLDGAFYSAAVGAPAFDLDPTEGLARSEYGRALFVALFDYAVANPLFSALGADFPQVPREVVLQAVGELGPELTELEVVLREAITELEPPEEVAADHALIVDFLETRRDSLDELLSAADAGDESALFAIGPAADAANCAVATELSETIKPIARAYFDANSPDCR